MTASAMQHARPQARSAEGRRNIIYLALFAMTALNYTDRVNSDRLLTPDALRRGARKWAVIASFIPTALVAAIPSIGSIWLLVIALTISVTFLANSVALNTALCNDLVRRPQDAGSAIALFTLGSNLIGVTAPIVTGYFVGASGNFDNAFLLTGTLLVVGALILLTMVRGGIGNDEPANAPVEAIR